MGQIKWEIEFYTKWDGSCPTKDFLNGLPAKDRAFVNNAIKRLKEHGLALTRPYIGYLRDHIRELRIRTNQGQYRLLHFVYDGNTFVMLHGITKKTGQVPDHAIQKAIEYKDDYLARKPKRQQ